MNDRILLFSLAKEIRGVDLLQPNYYTIPTISLPMAFVPVQIDYVARTREIFWTDSQNNELKKSSLTGGPIHTIIDTGIDR